MRRDDLYLRDIVAAADAIGHFIAGKSEDEFAGNDLLRSAVLHKLTVIGEAAARLSDDFKSRNANIPWRDIVSFRNHVVHRYFGVDWRIVWNSATIDAPALRLQVGRMIDASGDHPP